MKRILTVLALSVLLIVKINAQKHDYIWLTGYSSNDTDSTFGGSIIDFNVMPPDITYQFREMNLDACNVSMCDDEGNLLFYFNGIWIANSNHEQMVNGNNLGPDAYNQSWSGSGLPLVQGAISLPRPNSNNQYILVHEELKQGGLMGNIASIDNCFYSIIDMDLNGGLGEVTDKNIIIVNDTLDFGKLVATKHGNGRDWWVIIPEFSNNKYYKALITPNGIEQVNNQTIGDTSISGLGQAVFSLDGNKYARYGVHSTLEPSYIDIFDFDRCNGEFSNPYRIVIDTADVGFINGFTGLIFSPNGNILYHLNRDAIVQYDMTVTDIIASKDTVATYDGFIAPGPFPFETSFFLGQTGPDEKIYISTSAVTEYMHIIHNPNILGEGCNVEQHGLELPTYNNRSMPNFPNYRLYAEVGSSCDTLRPIAQFTHLPDMLNVAFTDESQRTPTEWFWTFGEGGSSTEQNPQYVYNTSGMYEVCLMVTNEAGSDTICQMVEIILDGVDELEFSESIVISPNPTSGLLRIKLPERRIEDWEITFYDALGRILLRKYLRKNTDEENVLLHDFPSGVFSIK